MTKRPPHRPSRRAVVVDAAMGLFAVHQPEEVTVADIAAASDMTAAAVYYHFPSKEHVLLEGLQHFATDLLAETRELARDSRSEGWVERMITQLLDWLEEHRTPATVYFAHSAGVDAFVEALRRETRIALVSMLARAIRTHRGLSKSNVEPEVAAIALISLIETGASSWLTHDSVFMALGRRRFVAEMRELAERLIGAAAPTPAIKGA